MTYCVGVALDEGMVFVSDTRTNAGVDDISTFRKMHSFEKPGERAFTLLSSGNLATGQMVASILEDRANSASRSGPTVMNAPSLFETARLVGSTLLEVAEAFAEENQEEKSKFHATMILGGQIKGDKPRLFLIYPEGNFIEAGADTPYFQIGETKYGRPILLRAYSRDMSFEDAVKLLLVSFDTTIRANLSVGLPLDIQIYRNGSLKLDKRLRIDESNEYFRMISERWGTSLRNAIGELPDFSFESATLARK